MKHSLKSAECDTVRVTMISRGLSVRALAAACGVKEITFQNQIAKSFPSRRLRLLVENALGIPIWSSASDFGQRQNLAKSVGFDPFVLHVPDLRRELRRLKVRGQSQARRHGELISLLKAHLSKVSTQQNHD